MPSKKLKILLINTDDSMGGAAIACLRLLDILQKKQGIEANLLVQEKKTNLLTINEIANSKLKKRMAFIRFALERLYFRFFEKNKEVRFAFSPANVGIDISKHSLVQEADILHLHWTNFGFLSLNSLEKLLNLNKPIVWTMHDMWIFTGGCHHSGDCENYQNACGNCFQYLENPSEKDLSNQVWSKKSTIFNALSLHLERGMGGEVNTKITLVGCSNWLANRAKKSSLFQNFHINSIPNPIDIDIFKPQNKTDSRQKLGLPTDKKLILFVAMKASVLWKGFQYFQESLELLKIQNSDNQQIELIILGESDKDLIKKLPFKSHALGRISDFQKIAMIYSAADVFVIPSIQENLPNTIMESMACGTPVVGFEVGGIPEMIEHKKTGFLVKYKSVESLTEGITWILNSDLTTFENLSSNCRKKVVENYSAEVVANKYVNLYKELSDASVNKFTD